MARRDKDKPKARIKKKYLEKGDPRLPTVRKKRNTKIIVSKKKRKAFLECLAVTGKVGASARAVGYSSTRYLRRLKTEDEDFANEWEQALQSAGDILADAAFERATEGVYEPVFHKGMIVGHKINYSDSLLQFMLRKINPAYRDSNKTGDTNINVGIAVMPGKAPSDAEWENNAVNMHDQQHVITLDDKPVENNLINRNKNKITRGD